MRVAAVAVALMALAFLACRPDLEGSLTGAHSYKAGDQVESTARLTVRNTGTADAYGSQDGPTGKAYHKVDIVLSTDRTAPIRFATVPDPYRFEEDMLLRGGRISTWTVRDGESVEYSADHAPSLLGIIPDSLRELTGKDSLYLIAVIDPGNEIIESDENNNLAVHTFQLPR